MKWQKQGRIWKPNGAWWSQHYGMLPTPVYLPQQNRIRIYFGTTDKYLFGRITFLEVNADDPSQIVYEHDSYILDIGEDGTFDDCGVAPTCAIHGNKEILLYTFGFQRSHKVPIHMNAGLAISTDGIKFCRYSQIPILPRHPSQPFFQSAPTVAKLNGEYHMWFPFGTGWFDFNGKKTPEYAIGHAKSEDGKYWQVSEKTVLSPNKEKKEFGFGRPWIVINKNSYMLFFSRRYIMDEKINYRIAYANSYDNGNSWQRQDDNIIPPSSDNSWDSEMTCYAAVIFVKNRWLMFYNGNGNGKTGFGWAQLDGDL